MPFMTPEARGALARRRPGWAARAALTPGGRWRTINDTSNTPYVGLEREPRFWRMLRIVAFDSALTKAG